MIGKELVKIIKRHKGKVMVPMLVKHDVIYVVAEKKDLIATLDTPHECGLRYHFNIHRELFLETED